MKISQPLPPHFILGDPMDNELIKEAMTMMYGPILEKYGGTTNDPTGLLLRLLPAVIHHSAFLQEVIKNVPGCQFSTIPLLQNP
jgi:hypothetical protein